MSAYDLDRYVSGAADGGEPTVRTLWNEVTVTSLCVGWYIRNVLTGKCYFVGVTRARGVPVPIYCVYCICDGVGVKMNQSFSLDERDQCRCLCCAWFFVFRTIDIPGSRTCVSTGKRTGIDQFVYDA